MNITFNGLQMNIPADCNVLELLRSQGLAERRVAVERNGSIVPRSLHLSTVLADGDRVEVVQAIGGG